MNIAIVGSGPTGMIAAKFLLEFEQFHVTMFTSDDKTTSSRLGDTFVKSSLNDVSMYDLGTFTKMENDQTMFQGFSPSKSISGFSSVWGAALDGYDDGSLLATNGQTWLTRPSNRISCQTLKQGEGITKIETSRLAIAPNLCIECGLCILGCPENAIWKSEYLLEDLKLLPNFEIRNERVERVRNTEIASVITSIGQKDFDYIFMAPGVISTASIIANSFINVNKFAISDSQTLFLAGLKTRFSAQHGKYSLSQITMSHQSKELNFYLQVYPNSKHLLNQATSSFGRILGKIIKLFWPWASRFLITGVLYLDQDLSSEIELSFDRNTNSFNATATQPKQNVEMKKIYRLIRRNFVSIGGIYFSILTKDRGVGAGFHSGNLRIIDESKKYKNLRNFASENMPRIIFLGASSQEYIEAGPVTSKMLRDVKKELHSFLKKLPLE